jgi:hypothetical protein
MSVAGIVQVHAVHVNISSLGKALAFFCCIFHSSYACTALAGPLLPFTFAPGIFLCKAHNQKSSFFSRLIQEAAASSIPSFEPRNAAKDKVCGPLLHKSLQSCPFVCAKFQEVEFPGFYVPRCPAHVYLEVFPACNLAGKLNSTLGPLVRESFIRSHTFPPPSN